MIPCTRIDCSGLWPGSSVAGLDRSTASKLVSHGSMFYYYFFFGWNMKPWCHQATCLHTLVEIRKTELAPNSIFSS